MGVWLKSNAPSICTYAYILGFNLEGSRRLKVISACSSRWYNVFMRKLAYVENNPVMKRSFKVLMDLSPALCQCMLGGSSCK